MKFGGRSLWQVLGLYLAGGWVILQVIDVLVDNIGLPPWTFRLALALLAAAVAGVWPGDPGDPQARERPLVVCTGGEPLLQLDGGAVAALHEAGFEVAVETNGTIEAPPGLDWICVSPKAGADLVQRRGHEMKLVYPQDAAPPDAYEDLAFDHFFLQPMDGPRRAQNTKLAVEYCLAHPRWRLSLQTHKYLGID